MDDSVQRAMQIWPNVPDCYGWLSLDRRGSWFLRGERISNYKVIEFIERNYLQTDSGGYCFQNGPQRVHVNLALAPYVAKIPKPNTVKWRVSLNEELRDLAVTALWVSDEGFVYLRAGTQIAVLDDRDLPGFVERLTVSDSRSRLDDEQILALFAGLMEGDAVDLALDTGEALLPLTAVREVDVENTLGFVRNPEAERAPA